MNLFFIVAISFALLFLLWIALRRSPAEISTNERSASSSDYAVRLPARALLDSMLSPEDVEYASRIHSPAILRLVLRERRRLATAWLRQARHEAGRLFRLHVRTVRQAEGLRPAAEVKLVLVAGSFLVVCAVMMAAISLYGPLRTRGFLQSLHTLANVLSGLSGRIADSISPALVPQFNVSGGR